MCAVLCGILWSLSGKTAQASHIPHDVGATIGNSSYKSKYAYNLNVVYFVPSDGDTLSGYRQRISELLLWAQKSTEAAMARHGYAEKTFGLLVNDRQEVKIQLIRSKYCYSELPYEGSAGANRAHQEVTAFYNQFPNEKNSVHTLIIYPSALKSDGIQAVASTPFYGIGNYGHALDYPLLSLGNIKIAGPIGNEARHWFGGMVHEMFHALNLPHNTLTALEAGTPIMRFHGRLGRDPVILTAADAAILNLNQICSKAISIHYTPSENILHIDPPVYDSESKTILITGQFSTTQPVNSVLIYIDPYEERDRKEGKPGAANTDYDAVSFVSKPSNNTFEIAIPIAALRNFDPNIDHYIRINLAHENGLLATNAHISHFRFNQDKIPNMAGNMFAKKPH